MVRISKKREKSYSDWTQKPDKELLGRFEQLREILSNFNQFLNQIQTWAQGQRQGQEAAQ